MLKVVLRQARKEHWRNALLSIGFYVMGALMPVWLSFVLLLLFSQPIGLGTFLDNGQFAIYAAAALSSILYSLSKQGPGQERTFYQLLILFCLIVAAAIFSGLTVVDTLKTVDFPINVAFLRASSITIYVVALAATFLVDIHENAYNELNVAEERSHRQERLEEEFSREMGSLEEDST